MTLYTVAYKNADTKGEWVRIDGWIALTDAKHRAATRVENMSNSAIAVFSENHWPAADRPAYIYNRHVLVALSGGRISSSLGGIINARQADWF